MEVSNYTNDIVLHISLVLNYETIGVCVLGVKIRFFRVPKYNCGVWLPWDFVSKYMYSKYIYKLAAKNYTSIMCIVILAQLQFFIQITTTKKRNLAE